MAVTNAPPLPDAPIAEPKDDPVTGQTQLLVTKPFSIMFRDLRRDIDQAPRQAIDPIVIPAGNASVATTDVITPTSDGAYGFQYYAAVTTAAGVSSSLTVVLGWTDSGVAKTKSFTAMTGNTTTTNSSEDYLIAADANAPITYTLTYASNAANAMVYRFVGVLSSVAGVA